jgi:hypothetical protein
MHERRAAGVPHGGCGGGGGRAGRPGWTVMSGMALLWAMSALPISRVFLMPSTIFSSPYLRRAPEIILN